MNRTLTSLCLAAGLAFTASTAQAVVVNWTDWTDVTTNRVDGNLDVGGTNVGVRYDGPYAFVQTDCGTNYWSEDSPPPFTGGIVENAPPNCEIIALNAGGTKTITFDQAVTDPFIGLVSWNGNVVDFGTGIEIISQGDGFWGVGTIDLNDAGTGFTGAGEVHGIIRLPGTFTSITFTDTSENWHGFTVGVLGLDDGNGPGPVETSEPAAFSLLGIGLAGLIAWRRRRSR